MDNVSPSTPVSPLRQRMLDDMLIRGLGEHTRQDYVRHVRTFAAFLGRSPDTATSEELRRFQLHQHENGVGVASINGAVSALRFFFGVTLGRPDLARSLVVTRHNRKLPDVLSVEEAARLLEAAPGTKYKAALGVAYGAGLRVSEVAHLKVDDIDSTRMLIRVEQGKGRKDRKDRNAMLSPQLLDLLRLWWREGKQRGVMLPHGWLFPGQGRTEPISTRQLHRAVQEAAERACIRKRVSPHTLRHSFATYLLEQDVDIRVIQVLLGHSKLETTALYTKVSTRTIQAVASPLERLMALMGAGRPRGAGRPTIETVPASLEVADIFRSAGPAYRTAHEGHLSLHQLKVMSAVEACRTAALGGHVEACDACGHRRIAYNSCRNRHCPKCQGVAARTWLAEREADLLPVGYFHVVFTLPAEIGEIAFHNKALVYDLLFRTAAQTMLTIAADPRHLGARIGITAVLHSWGSAMTHHPHIHMIVPGGGIAPDGRRWISSRPSFLLPVRVLGMLFRRLFLERLVDLHRAGKLRFFGALAGLANARAFFRHLAPVRKARWVVYAKPPFAGPEAVLAYLARYTHRVAIANRRLIAFDESGVTFQYKDYRRDGAARRQVMTLHPHEFMRRFLLHVLPRGFHRIRHYGLLAGSARKESIAKARELLATGPAMKAEDPQTTPRETNAPEPGSSDHRPPCPCCGGRMIIIETFARWNQPRGPPDRSTPTRECPL